ncbi:adenine deaminase [Paenibacillus sp. DXFW5]|uniref:Adenine deaminase n=1 Tax=Paenibacillus rhizolycopersici TaxID=2780073 RepID=A0ABS2H2Z9_9BACL|nr:adenine deaminase [Paenibacillus rhizolycopersici]MBM6995810.1 adenine deaminase [Paenibacillus rhizolycopersici]
MKQSARKKLYEVSRTLANVAMGKAKADLVVKGGTLVNVYTGELLPQTDVAVAEGRIAFVGNAEHTFGEDTVVIDAAGRHIVPGLLDGHMHVESTMLSVAEFAKAALAKGTTGIFMDPHEIANVFGAEGVRWMHEEGQVLPLKVYTTFPSCVPATDHLEDAGASLNTDDIAEGMTWDGVEGLGEVMNFPGVVFGDPKMHGEIQATMEAGKTVTGHFPSDDERMLQAYTASGVTSCHETVTREQGLAKLRIGMHLMIREGSAWHDVKEVIKVVTEDKVNPSNILLVTDDVYPQTLIEQGHMNHVVRRAIEEGVDPVTAIQMGTINTARYFKVDGDLGGIAPGKCADLLLIGDLRRMEPSTVITDGKVAYDDGQLRVPFPAYPYPPQARASVKLARPLTAADFLYRSASGKEQTTIHVIDVIENSARTAKGTATVKVDGDGIVRLAAEQDITTLACIDRHRGSGELSLAFARGFGLKQGAVASTVAHDSHNLLVMGTNPEDMAFAANELAKLGGGMIAVLDGQVLAAVPMAIAGLMSDQPLETVVTQVKGLEAAWKQLGCQLNAPFMTFSLIALPVIPELRITNRGLAEVNEFKLVPVEID